MRQTVRRVAPLTLLLLAAVGVPAVAQNGGRPEPREPQYGPGYTPETIAENERHGQEAERERVKREQKLRGPEAREARKRSRTAHRRMNRGEALKLLRDRFDRELDMLQWEPYESIRANGATKFLDDHTVVVDRPGENNRLAVSTFPLRVPTESGGKEPVDLTLEDRGGAFETRNGIVDVRLPERLEQGIDIGGAGLRLNVTQAAGTGVVKGSLSDEGVLYPQVAADTDWLVKSVATGIEALTFIRSPEAPEVHDMPLDLPAGARLRLEERTGAVEVVRGDEIVGLVRPPFALDAQGQQVPVSYGVTGETIEVRVPHRDRDIAYPILVDPQVEDWNWRSGNWDFGGWHQNSPMGYRGNGWGYFTQQNGGGSAGSNYGSGLYVYAAPGWYDGNYAQWNFFAPRAEWWDSRPNTAYFSRATMYNSAFQPRNESAEMHWGIWSQRGGDWSSVAVFRHQFDWGWVHALPGRRVDSNTAGEITRDERWYYGNRETGDLVLGSIWIGPCCVYRSQWAHAYFGGASLELEDPDTAYVQGVAAELQPGGWVGDRTFAGNITARDDGFGVNHVRLSGSGVWEDRWQGCEGGDWYRCNYLFQSWVSYSTGPMPQGSNRLVAEAWDVVGKGNGTGWWIKVDKTGPTLGAISGSLSSARGKSLSADSYGVRVSANDAYSGVDAIQLKVGEAVVDSASNTTCGGDGCGQSADLSWRPGDLNAGNRRFPDGVHRVSVWAGDRTGSPGANWTKLDEWDVIVDRDAPQQPSVTSTGLPAGWFDTDTPTARVSASDRGAGVKRFSLEAPGRGWSQSGREEQCSGTVAARCPTDPPPNDIAYNSGGNRLPEGIVSLRARVADAADPSKSSASAGWTARVDHSAPRADLTGVLWDRRNGALTDASYALRVDATDNPNATTSPPADEQARSGVESIRVYVDGQTRPEWVYTASCTTNGCPMRGSFDWSFNADEFTDGEHEIKVVTKDQLGTQPGHQDTDTFVVLVDRKPPSSVAVEHLGLPTGWFDNATPTARITATDAGSGIRRFLLDSPDTDGDPAASGWRQETSYDCGRDGEPRCPKTRTGDLVYNQTGNPLPEGSTPVRAQAFDAADRGAAAPSIAQAKVDRTPPSVTLSGPLKDSENKTLYAGVYPLKVDASDGATATPRSGVKGIRVYVDDALKDEASQPCEAGSCPMSRNWAFHPDEYSPGWHTIKVEASDQLADEPGLAERHTRTETFRVQVGDEAARVQDRTGLENFYQYETTETGAETRAHVNLATGNLVWHTVPIVNPGRGLSTVVNLTYNSQERATDFFSTTDVTAYNQVGRGFSLGISGLTRVNEPLDLTAAPAGVVKLTDPDGTQHVFRQSRDGVTFLPPPGVNLHLRRFAPLTEPDPLTGLPRPVVASKKAWAATRPDGVTYYFDQRGYQTSIEDRNANTLTFRYAYRNKLTGAVCDFVEANVGISEAGPADDLVCKPFLEAVRDAGDRDLQVRYDEAPIAGVPGATLPGKIREIEDHAGRITDFDYDALGQDLVATTSAKGAQYEGTPVERRFGFTYEALGPVMGGTPDRDLISVTDPRNATTQIAYAAYDTLSSGSGTAQTTKRVDSIRNRNGFLTDFDYGRVGDDPGQSVVGHETAKVLDARGQLTQYRLDKRARLLDMADPRGVVTALAWDEDNNATTVTQAKGTADEATTSMQYDPNGLLTASTRAAGTGDARRTELSYESGPGTQLSGRTALVPQAPLGQPEPGVDVGKTFVSDLVSIKTPAGGTTTLDPDERGNVGVTADPEGHQVKTLYDAKGQVIEERAWNDKKPTEPNAQPDVTTYSDYDPNGLPRLRTDARGNATTGAGDGQWRYAYDAVGNLLTVTDPRGGGGGDQRFTTTLTYDALDQLRKERIPKRSEENVFVERTTGFDSNGNVETTTDGEDAVTSRSYTAMDEVKEVRSPAVKHEGETGTSSEVTRFTYDPEGNLVLEERPNGTKDRAAPPATPDPVSHSTTYQYDSVGQRLVETRHSVGDAVKRLRTSFAYDLRGNTVGVVDPKRNGDASSDDAAATAAQDPTRRRLSFVYDKAENRIRQFEDPGGESYRTDFTYDLNDNRKTVVDPRAFRDLPADKTADDYTTRFDYDRRDLLVSIEDANDEVTEFELRPDGRLRRETKPRGTASDAAGDFETRYTYNANGELASRSLPRAADQYGPADLEVSYVRNAVGDPVTITDPRGNSFTNTFFDTGELLTTERPSWWKYGPQRGGEGAEGAAIQERSPEEMGTGADEAELPESQGKGDFGEVEPEQMPDWLPKKGKTEFAYDSEMRLTAVTDVTGAQSTMTYDALGRITATKRPLDLSPEGTADDRYIAAAFAYDRHGNLRRATDGEGHATTVDYDQFDRAITERRPGSGDEPDVTRYAYDDNGNMTSRQTPRGASFTERMCYDALDRLTSQRNPADEETTYAYDAAGNPTAERSPRGNLPALEDAAGDPECRTLDEDAAREPFTTRRAYDGLNRLTEVSDGLDHVTTFGYDANGNQNKVVAPGARRGPGEPIQAQVIRREFDGRDLLWTETTGAETSGAGNDRRTTVTEYDPNGNLRRTVNPAGADEDTRRPKFTGEGDEGREAEIRSYTSDNLLSTIDLPWGTRDADDRTRFRQEFEHDSRGFVNSIDSPYDVAEGKKGRTSYTHFDTGWIKSSTDPTLVNQTSNQEVYRQAMTYDYDARGNQTLWESDKGRRVTRHMFPSGTLANRKAYRNSSDTTPRTYTYAYNENGSRTAMVDDRSGTSNDRATYTTYDDAERERSVNEAWTRTATRPAGKDTLTHYDPDGRPTGRYTDGKLETALGGTYSGGKHTSFVYDALGRETKTTVDPPDRDGIPAAEQAANRVTSTAYYPSGAREKRTREHNNVSETYFYNSDGQIARLRRQKPPAETSLKNQTYSYDQNGNRTADERGTHSFNSRDQLRRWDKPGPGSVDYTLNGSGAVTKEEETKADNTVVTTISSYTGDRLNSTSRGDAKTDYQYDDFGAVKQIKVEAQNGTAPPAVKESNFTYDEFERMTNASGPGLDSEATYTYDGLDRRDSRCEGGEGGAETCTGGTASDYSYVGSSELLSQEEGNGQSSAYDYDSLGDALGQTNQPSADDPATYRSYAKDANGSVEGLEDGSGEFGTDGQGREDRYEYDPYGALENEDHLSEVAKANPLRFEGFYYDEGLKAYDMQARPYRPDVGRFLTQDRFESARGDFNLVSDPLTGNRYAFAGGNPVSRVEWDGHCANFKDCGPYSGGNGVDPDSGRPKGGSGGGGVPRGGLIAPLLPLDQLRGEGPPAPKFCEFCTDLLIDHGRSVEDASGRPSPAECGDRCSGRVEEVPDLEIALGLGGLVGTGAKILGTKVVGGLVKKNVDDAAREGRRVVIGKQTGLDKPFYKPPFSGTRPWERELNLSYLGNHFADRMQNVAVLRQAMASGRPIRDSHRYLASGRLKDPGADSYLQLERQVLRQGGWNYSRITRKWYPGQ